MPFLALFSGAKVYLAVAIIAVLLTLGGLGAWYYHHTQEELAILNANNAKLTEVAATQKQTIVDLVSDAKEANQIVTKTQVIYKDRRTDIDSARTRIDSLQGKLPSDVESLTNKEISNSMICISLATGASQSQLGLNDNDYKNYKLSCSIN